MYRLFPCQRDQPMDQRLVAVPYIDRHLNSSVNVFSSGDQSTVIIQYIDLARAKSEALVNNSYKPKKLNRRLNRVMLNGDGNGNGIKINRSN